MTDLDQTTARRDITDALITALERRHEVLDAVVDAENRAAAVDAIATLLGKSKLGAEAVLGMSFYQLPKDQRRRNQAAYQASAPPAWGATSPTPPPVTVRPQCSR